MNWLDLLVGLIILGFGIIGLYKGFVLTIFKLVSFFVSVIVAVKFYPVFSKFLIQTPLYTGVKASILKNLLLQQQVQGPTVDAAAKQAAADTVINGLHLPGFLKDVLIKQIQPSKLLDTCAITDQISSYMAGMVMDILSLVLLYILIRIGLIFVRVILKGIAKLPVFKQVDKLGGFGFGAVEGLLTVYIFFAVVMLFNTNPSFKGIFEALDSSKIANFFYQHNFIVDWMFSKGKIM